MSRDGPDGSGKIEVASPISETVRVSDEVDSSTSQRPPCDKAIHTATAMATTATMEITLFQQASCELCGLYTWKDQMEHRDDEGLVCYNCAQLPPYSDELYNALVLIQRLFRRHFEEAAQPCFNCEKPTLKRYEFEGGLVCEHCKYELSEHDHDDDEHEHEHEEAEPCEECGNPHECVCAELREDARLARHRRICGFADCDGDCGTLDCGCTDKCKCCDWDDEDE